MSSAPQPNALRFDEFEIDLRTRELKRRSKALKMQDLPIRLLILLASRPGQLISREEIEQELWGENHFVDFEHGINTAMRKIREALEENLDAPRFIETLPRKGYRFIAQVEAVPDRQAPPAVPDANLAPEGAIARGAEADEAPPTSDSEPAYVPRSVTAEQPGEDFALPSTPARNLFLFTQVGYLAMYCATLLKLEDAVRVLDLLLGVPASKTIPLLIALAICGIAVRLYLITSVGLSHPAAGAKYRRLFPVVFVLDVIWAASPLLLFEKIGMGLSMAAIAGLAYLPFSQRILMSSIYRAT